LVSPAIGNSTPGFVVGIGERVFSSRNVEV
jgi:hypothetical protein